MYVYKGGGWWGRWERDGMCDGGGWAARGRLNPLLGQSGLAMSPKSVSQGIGPNMLKGPKQRLTIAGINISPIPSM